MFQPPPDHRHYDVLLGYLLETERLGQQLRQTSDSSPLVHHASQLCQHYLGNLLDMQNNLQRLQQSRHHESNIGERLAVLLDSLQHFPQNKCPTRADDMAYRTAITKLANNIRCYLQEGEKIQATLATTLSPAAKATAPLATAPAPKVAATTAHAQPAEPSPPPVTAHTASATPKLDVYLFGEFKASLNGIPIKRWPHGKGQQIFKYLLLYRTTPVRKERLMETFWPEIDARAARNNLNVSIYYLRQDLSRYHKTFQFVLYQDDCYRLNPELALWVDVEAFEQASRTAHRHLANRDTAQAIAAYRDAEALYKGDCLKEESTEWAALVTQAYRTKYLEILAYLADHLFGAGDYQACAELWQKAVTLDSCDERAHEKIMQCYLKVGQRQLALRQYHLCVESLHKELGLEPSPRLLQLLEQIHQADS